MSAPNVKYSPVSELLSTSAALVPAYAACDHGAIGNCALCEGPCTSCGAELKPARKAVRFPFEESRCPNDHLHCGLCGAMADHLDKGE